MEDVLAKIQKLIALAASSNVDEARNAAYLAVKLIRDHDLVVARAAPSNGTSFPPPSVRVTVKVRSDLMEWKKIKAKFQGQCVECGDIIKANSFIYWSPLHPGAYHSACFNKKHQPKK